jgi:Tautomerase enzyme
MIVANTQVTDCASWSSPALINRKSLTPLARIDLQAGKPPEYGRAVADAVHNAMIATLNAPKDDRFHVIFRGTLPFHDQKGSPEFHLGRGAC